MSEQIKVRYSPQGGRYGYGYDYYCIVCSEKLGESGDKQLYHPAMVVKWLYYKTKTPVSCPHGGETYTMPKHETAVEKLL